MIGTIIFDDFTKVDLRIGTIIEVEDFPATVINDIYGGDLYQEGKAKYRID